MSDLLQINTPYSPNYGSFARSKGCVGGRHVVGPWHTCRENWHMEMRTAPLFFFSHPEGRAVPEFIFFAEDLLDCPRSRLGPTQRKTITWVEPSSWWFGGAMRRSFFTVLLKVGQKHRKNDDFRESLYSHPYTTHTRYAVERFLSGYTRYTGRLTGWYNQFCKKASGRAEIDRLLAK